MLGFMLAILIFIFFPKAEPVREQDVKQNIPANQSENEVITNRKKFFDVGSLADFFETRREDFDSILKEVESSQTLFCIDTWGGEDEIIPYQDRAVCKEDIINYDELLLEMERLSITRIDYYNQDPTQVIFYFSSTSSIWSLYVIYGQDIPNPDTELSLDEYIDLGDSWLVYGDCHG